MTGEAQSVDVERKVREFIVANRKGDLPGTITPEFRLIDNGILDSMAMFEVIAFLEDSYGIEITDDDLVAENFETTEAIARMVSAKTRP